MQKILNNIFFISESKRKIYWTIPHFVTFFLSWILIGQVKKVIIDCFIFMWSSRNPFDPLNVSNRVEKGKVFVSKRIFLFEICLRTSEQAEQVIIIFLSPPGNIASKSLEKFLFVCCTLMRSKQIRGDKRIVYVRHICLTNKKSQTETHSIVLSSSFEGWKRRK